MSSVAQYIVNGLSLELDQKLHTRIERRLDTVCAITGERITDGVLWRHVIPDSTAEYLDLMSGMAFPYLSLSAAAAFKGSWNMGSRLIFEDGTMYHPYISSKSAAESERTHWSAIIRDVWPDHQGENCLCIVTDDYKKKVWPRARIGQLGVNTQVLLFDSGRLQLQNLVVDWELLIDTLDFVEEVYTAGFNKQAISGGLYICYAALMERGEAALDWESKLVELRKAPEFNVAVLVAQKPLVQKEVGQLKLL